MKVAIGMTVVVVGLGAIGAHAATRPAGALVQVRSATLCDAETALTRCKKARALKDPTSLVIAPDGRSLYVVADSTASITGFRRNPTTGVLRELPGASGCRSEFESRCGNADVLQGAASVAVSPDARQVYVGARVSDAITVYIRASGGGLSPAPAERRCVHADRRVDDGCVYAKLLGGVNTVVVTKDGRNLYATGTHGLASFTRNPRTGALTQLAGIEGCISLEGIDPYRAELEGDYFEDAGEIVCATARALAIPSDVESSPDGKNVYIAASGVNAIVVFARDRATGKLRQLEGEAGCLGSEDDLENGSCARVRGLDFVQSVAVSPDGRTLYAAASGSNAVAVFRRDPATGSLRQLTATLGCVSEDGSEGREGTSGACADGAGLDAASSVVVSTDGRSVYVTSEHTLAAFARNRTTGALTQLKGANRCLSDLGGSCTKSFGLWFVAAAAVSQDGRHVYSVAGGSADPAAADRTANALAVFRRERTQ